MQSPKSSDIKLAHHRNSRVMRSNLMSHPLSPSLSAQMDDYIGTESCLDLKNYKHLLTENREDENNGARVQIYVRGKRDQRCSMKKKKREFPPPISLLARTENQPSCMPFALKRYHTDDGRLILREERVRHHEYFIKAYRSNGHLTLQLFHLDDDVLGRPFSEENEIELDEPYCKVEEEEQQEEATDDFVENSEKEIVRKNTEEAKAEYESKIAESSVENGTVPRAMGENGNGGGKCLKYNGVGINSSCFLGMPVPAIKPVHT